MGSAEACDTGFSRTGTRTDAPGRKTASGDDEAEVEERLCAFGGGGGSEGGKRTGAGDGSEAAEEAARAEADDPSETDGGTTRGSDGAAEEAEGPEADDPATGSPEATEDTRPAGRGDEEGRGADVLGAGAAGGVPLPEPCVPAAGGATEGARDEGEEEGKEEAREEDGGAGAPIAPGARVLPRDERLGFGAQRAGTGDDRANSAAQDVTTEVGIIRRNAEEAVERLSGRVAARTGGVKDERRKADGGVDAHKRLVVLPFFGRDLREVAGTRRDGNV